MEKYYSKNRPHYFFVSLCVIFPFLNISNYYVLKFRNTFILSFLYVCYNFVPPFQDVIITVIVCVNIYVYYNFSNHFLIL